MRRMRLWTYSPFALAFTLGIGQARSEGAFGEDCFDVKIHARIVNQIPMDLGEPDDGSIVMQWPWLIDFVVKPDKNKPQITGKMTVLSLQHTYWRDDLGYRRWLLRRNDAGGFNLIGLADDEEAIRCADNRPPARAFVRSANGESLDELRQAGIKRYGERHR